MTRAQILRWLPAAALSVGPCAAYFVWALTRRKWAHVVIASVLNITLWTAGPLFVWLVAQWSKV